MITALLIIVLLCTSISACLAQSNDMHLEKVITAINVGNYVRADQEMDKVQDWGCGKEHVFRIKNLQNAYLYLQHCQSSYSSQKSKDSIALYVVDECGSYLNDILLQGDQEEAEKVCLLALKMCEISFVKHHQDYALILINLSYIYQQKNNLLQAIEYGKRAIEVFKVNHLQENDNYCSIHLTIGGQYCRMKDLVSAYPYIKEAYDICMRLGGTKLRYYSPVARAYEKIEGNLAEYYQNNENYGEALSHYLNGLQLHEQVIGKDADYAVLLNNIGLVYSHLGDYKNAENYTLQALQIRKEWFGMNTDEYANSLNNTASYYQKTGYFEKAKNLYEEALTIYKSLYGEQNKDYATVIGNLGMVYSHLDNLLKAEQYVRKSLEIRQNILGKNHADCAIPLANLGTIYLTKKDYIAAYKCLMQALDIEKKNYGEHSPQVASTCTNIGVVWNAAKDYDKAVDYFTKAYAIYKNILGETHPETIVALENLGSTYFDKGDFKKAAPYWLKRYELRKRQFLLSLEFMTERQREKYLQTMRYTYEYAIPTLTYECFREDPTYAGIAYDNALFYKGALLQSSNVIKRSVLESGDTTLISQWNKLSEIRKQLTVLSEKYPSSSLISEYEEQEEQIEKQLTLSSATYRNTLQLLDTKWENVRASLLPNQLAIEFMTVPRNNAEYIYCALVLRKEFENPKLIPLCDGIEIWEIMQTATPDDLYNYDKYGRKLYNSVWAKIRQFIRQGDTIFFSATGLFHLLAIEALPIDQSKTMSSEYSIVRLSSTRELTNKQPEKRPSSASLFGGINYDVDIEKLIMLSESNSFEKMIATRSLIKETELRGRATYLQGTKNEIEEIFAILNPHLPSIAKHSADSATEESFKALSGAHLNIIHVATHGFYWPDTVAHNERYFKQRSAISDFTTQLEEIDPMDRCGLLFAGANTALSGHSNRIPEGVQDGILTAKEISSMNLRDANIVVLSACETGLGDISGEGVFGLQRAFKMAGAQSLLMSLWKVNDKATQMLMTAFYRYYSKGRTKREALRLAQQEVRESGYMNPYYWAGFIMLD